MRNFLGAYPALITPFRRNDQMIDFDRLEVLVKLLLKADVDGFVVNGSTGEAPYLTREERAKVIEFVKNCVGSKTIIAGVGGQSLRETTAYCKDAIKVGADALLVVTPYYFKPSQKALFEYYQGLKKEVDIPIILYNIPQLTGVEIPADIVARLIDGERIIGIKDSSGDIKYLTKVLYSIEEGYVFCGCDTILYPALVSGAHGLILASLNVLPNDIIRIFNLCKNGKFSEALRIYRELYPILDIIFKYGVLAVKRAFEYLGIDMGVTREPLDIYRDIPNDILDKLKTFLISKQPLQMP